MKEDVLLLFETAKARHEAAVREVHNILDVMVKQGLAKRLEDNNDDQDIIIIASPAIMEEIVGFSWEDGPEYWDSEDEIVILPHGEKIEWWPA